MKTVFGAIVLLVVGYAGYETALVTVSNPGEWSDLFSLVVNDLRLLLIYFSSVVFRPFC